MMVLNKAKKSNSFCEGVHKWLYELESRWVTSEWVSVWLKDIWIKYPFIGLCNEELVLVLRSKRIDKNKIDCLQDYKTLYAIHHIFWLNFACEKAENIKPPHFHQSKKKEERDNASQGKAGQSRARNGKPSDERYESPRGRSEEEEEPITKSQEPIAKTKESGQEERQANMVNHRGIQIRSTCGWLYRSLNAWISTRVEGSIIEWVEWFVNVR